MVLEYESKNLKLVLSNAQKEKQIEMLQKEIAAGGQKYSYTSTRTWFSKNKFEIIENPFY